MKQNTFYLRRVASFVLAILLLVATLMSLASCFDSYKRNVYLTLGEVDVPYDMVRCLVKQQLSAYSEEELQDETVREKIRETVLADLKKHYVIYSVAQELGLGLTDYDEDIIDSRLEQYKTLPDYEAMLKATFASDSVIKDIETAAYLEDRIYDYLCETSDRFASDNDTVDADLAGDRWYAAEYVVLLYDGVNHDARKEAMDEIRAAVLAGESLRNAAGEIETLYKDEYSFVTDGCFTDTIYPADFENTVKGLKEGEISQVVDTLTSSGYACLMLIRRVKIDKSYVDENYYTVKANYLARVFAEYMQEKADALTVAYREKYRDADLLAIE